MFIRMKKARTVTVRVSKEDMKAYTPSYKYQDLNVDMCLDLMNNFEIGAIDFFKSQGDEIARHTLTNMLKSNGINWNDVWDYNISTDVDPIEKVFRIQGTIGVKLGKGNIWESCQDYARELDTEYVRDLREKISMITSLIGDFKAKTGTDLLPHEQIEMLQKLEEFAKCMTIKVEIE